MLLVFAAMVTLPNEQDTYGFDLLGCIKTDFLPMFADARLIFPIWEMVPFNIVLNPQSQLV